MTAPPPPPASSYQPGYPTAQVGTELSGFWRRFGAYIIDAIIVGVIGAVIQAIVGAIVQPSTTDTTGVTIRSGLIGLVVELIYFGYLWSRNGQTIGYMALGIRVVRAEGGPVTLGVAVLRAFLIYLSFAICLVPAIISAFMIGLGQRKQAIHDLLVGTVVVRA
ncbi:MAG TPA: RDD family protein [Candidatus Dormibacteraeota bacterium]|nr:RDD family protein [Candidatus Dormibacteraeota bacterium]